MNHCTDDDFYIFARIVDDGVGTVQYTGLLQPLSASSNGLILLASSLSVLYRSYCSNNNDIVAIVHLRYLRYSGSSSSSSSEEYKYEIGDYYYEDTEIIM